MPTTPNYGFIVPDVLGSTNVWGGLLNDALGIPAIPVVPNIDTEMQRIDDVAANADTVAADALPKAGGTMTGILEEHSATLKTVDLGTAVGAVAMDLAEANFFLAQPQAATATQYVFINPPQTDSVVSIVFLQILTGGDSLVTWDTKILWPGTAVPALTTFVATDLLGFYSPDKGVTWYGSLVQRDVR